jgi:hypothetical protein
MRADLVAEEGSIRAGTRVFTAVLVLPMGADVNRDRSARASEIVT